MLNTFSIYQPKMSNDDGKGFLFLVRGIVVQVTSVESVMSGAWCGLPHECLTSDRQLEEC